MSHKKLQQHISRLMALLLCLMLLLPGIPVVRAEGESGSCGSNLTWSLNAGTLTISGSGHMSDFPESTMAPWYHLRNEILRVELPSGLTSIGDLAFYECKELIAVVIPDSVTSIGKYAFAWCQNLQILTMGKGVRSIGDSAFSECFRMTSLELPSSLTKIGTKAFYRCESITSVTVPSSVESMGVSVFAYCKGLVTANVLAAIETLPEYTFYGCERLASVKLPDATEDVSTYSFRGCHQLETVYYGGENQDVSALKSEIGSELPKFDAIGTVTNTPSDAPVSSGSVWVDENGNYGQDNVTVTTGENSSIAAKVEHTNQPDGTTIGTSAAIDVNVNNQQGWGEVLDTVTQEIDRVSEQTDNVTVNVYVKETDTIDSDFMDAMAEKNVTVTFTTDNGSSWVVGDGQWNAGKESVSYNLSHSITTGSPDHFAALDGNYCFDLTFAQSADVNSEIMVYLGSTWANQEATLLQWEKDGPKEIQTTVVDRDGYAHFYLGSVNSTIIYGIGMNLPRDESSAVPLIPEIAQTGNNVVNYSPVEYEITGRSSSWGMDLKQVMSILAVVMISVIAVVGVIMFIWNKKRLKSGYVPNWDDEDE